MYSRLKSSSASEASWRLTGISVWDDIHPNFDCVSSGWAVAVFGERPASVFIRDGVAGGPPLSCVVGVPMALACLVAPLLRLAVPAFNVVSGHRACCSADGSSCDTSIAFSDLASNKTASQGADCGSSSIFV